MDNILLRTASIFEDCYDHLKKSNSFNTEIESYLTQFILVILSADMQQEIYKITDSRALKITDEQIRFFVQTASKKLFRSVSKEKIADHVSLFGENQKNRFNASLKDSDISIYSNAIQNRHKVAHHRGTNITLNELKKAIEAAKQILIAAHTILLEEYASGTGRTEPKSNSGMPAQEKALLESFQPADLFDGADDRNRTGTPFGEEF